MPPSPRTRILGATLRNTRIEANFGLRELARRIGVTPAMLSNWEQARRSPSVADVAGILGALGTAGETKHHILGLARGADDESWVVHGKPLSIDRSSALIAHRAAAHSIVTWDPLAIPEILKVVDKCVESRATVVEAFISESAFRAEAVRIKDLLLQKASPPQLAKTRQRLVIRTVCADRALRYGLTTAFDRYTMADGEAVLYYGQQNFGLFVAGHNGRASPHDADIDRLRQIASELHESLDQVVHRVGPLTMS